jgi:SAM-dependent methyltransferase
MASNAGLIPEHGKWGVSKPGSLPTRVAKRQRRLMFDRFLKTLSPMAADTVLDVGVTNDREHDHSNYFEAWYPHKARVTASGLEDASFLEELYPGMRFVQADARDLPFADGSHDFVHSSAVIEHAGSHQEQIAFLGELWRVARRGIFVTTPNRWFPIEVHTVLPLVHYLPPKAFRAILRSLGRDFFAEEANLNLLSRRTLASAARSAGVRNFRIEAVSLMGLPSNLLLIAEKGPVT